MYINENIPVKLNLHKDDSETLFLEVYSVSENG